MSMKALEWAMYDVPAEMTKGRFSASSSRSPTMPTPKETARSHPRNAYARSLGTAAALSSTDSTTWRHPD